MPTLQSSVIAQTSVLNYKAFVPNIVFCNGKLICVRCAFLSKNSSIRWENHNNKLNWWTLESSIEFCHGFSLTEKRSSTWVQFYKMYQLLKEFLPLMLPIRTITVELWCGCLDNGRMNADTLLFVNSLKTVHLLKWEYSTPIMKLFKYFTGLVFKWNKPMIVVDSLRIWMVLIVWKSCDWQSFCFPMQVCFLILHYKYLIIFLLWDLSFAVVLGLRLSKQI